MQNPFSPYSVSNTPYWAGPCPTWMPSSPCQGSPTAPQTMPESGLPPYSTCTPGVQIPNPCGEIPSHPIRALNPHTGHTLPSLLGLWLLMPGCFSVEVPSSLSLGQLCTRPPGLWHPVLAHCDFPFSPGMDRSLTLPHLMAVDWIIQKRKWREAKGKERGKRSRDTLTGRVFLTY